MWFGCGAAAGYNRGRVDRTRRLAMLDRLATVLVSVAAPYMLLKATADRPR